MGRDAYMPPLAREGKRCSDSWGSQRGRVSQLLALHVSDKPPNKGGKDACY